MKSGAIIAFVVALAASGSAAAQGVGLRLGAAGTAGDFGRWIAPALDTRIGYAAPAWRARGLGVEGGARPETLGGIVERDNAIAPYLGLGYGRLAGVGVNFYFDLGLVYRGLESSTLAGGCASSLSPSLCAQTPSDAGAGRSSLERYNLYPIGRVGVSVGF
ncbi:MAG: hypothetical protein WAU52_13005 [Burkholderiales bacterium]